MILTRKYLPRRTLLRAAGASIALPLLDCMTPALRASADDRAIRRVAVVYVPNGMVMEHWTPMSDGTFPATLEPLEGFRRRLSVLSGLRNGPPSYAVHAAASTKFLTTVPPRPSNGIGVSAGVSVDQVIAKRIGTDTRVRSLEISLESGHPGTCDIASSCVYTDTISWAGPLTPLPMEHNPRLVFERLFGEADGTSPSGRLTRIGVERSLLDSVREAAGNLRRQVGVADATRIDEYLDAVRDAEGRIQLSERQSNAAVAIERPLGVPQSFGLHARLMFDLLTLAFQSDLTRVATFMLGREFSGRAYPEVGAAEAHHPTSHHQNDPVKLAKLSRINQYHIDQLAYFLRRLEMTADGGGALIDHVTLLYGAGMSDGNAHSPENVPILLVDSAGSGQSGRHLQYPAGTPLANLHMALLRKFGVDATSFGDSTGVLPGM
jgi:hypothetical protein